MRNLRAVCVSLAVVFLVLGCVGLFVSFAFLTSSQLPDLIAGLAGSATAELRVPSSVFEMDELEEAKAKAAKDKEPLVIVYTDPGTT